MCLITPNKRKKIAKNDTTVYKLLSQNFSAFFMSNFTYELGVVNKTTIVQSDDWSCFDKVDENYLDTAYPDWMNGGEENLICISRGFHSAKTIERLSIEMYDDSDIFYKPVLVECTIPKGSEYYEDNTDLLVSDTIIINRVVPQEESSTT